MRDALKRQGILNVEEYLTPPDQLPQPQPDPMAQMQQQLAAKQDRTARASNSCGRVESPN